MPRTLGLLIAVLIIALLGALAITLNDNTGLRFYLDGVFQGESESLDIHAGNGIEVIADSSPDQTDYTINAHLGATIGGGTPVPHHSGSGTAVADTIDVESPDGSLKVTAKHTASAGHNVIEFDLNDAAIEVQASGTPVAVSTATTPVPIRRPAVNFVEGDGIVLLLTDEPTEERTDVTVTLDGLEFYQFDATNSTQVQDTTTAAVRFDQFELRGGNNVTVTTADTTDDRVVYEVAATEDETIGFSEGGGTETDGDALNLIEGTGIDLTYTAPSGPTGRGRL